MKKKKDFEFKKKEDLRGGMHTHVTRVSDKDSGKRWAIKEGRTDMVLPLTKNLELPIDRQFWSDFLGPVGFDIMPTSDRVAKDLRDYFLVAKYFGYFEEDHKIFGDNEFVREEQRKLRKHLENFDRKENSISSLIGRLVDNDEKKLKLIKDAIKSRDVVNYNFLVKEYVILAKSAKSGMKKTFYIVQEWVEGYTLENFLEEDMTKKIYGRLLVFIILALHIFEEEQKVVDTRGVGLGYINQFVATENIVISPEVEGVKFIDTRSLWDLTGSFVEKGLLSSDILLASLIQTFTEYLNKLPS